MIGIQGKTENPILSNARIIPHSSLIRSYNGSHPIMKDSRAKKRLSISGGVVARRRASSTH